MTAYPVAAGDDSENALSALGHLEPPQERAAWLKLLMAARHAGISEDDARAWSARGENFDAADFRSAWRSIRSGPVTKRTLFRAALDAGWEPLPDGKKLSRAEIGACEARRTESAMKEAKEQNDRHAKAAKRAAKIWDEAKPANDHAYLVRKNVKAHGLRIGQWESIDRRTGEVHVIEDALLIQIRDMAKITHSLQAIFPSSENVLGRDRTYLAGGAKRGHFFAIGQPKTIDGKKVIAICEGYATAASIYEATGCAVVVAFDAGNLEPVARVIREHIPSANIVIFSDRDAELLAESAGTAAAMRAALATKAHVVVPEWTGLPGRDANDIARSGFTWGSTTFQGFEILRGCIKFATPFGSAAFLEILAECRIETDLLSHRPDTSQGNLEAIKPHSGFAPEQMMQGNDGVDTLLLQSPTQDSVAVVLRRRFEGRLLFAHNFGCWLEWDGTRWRREETELAFDLVRRLARDLNVEGKASLSTANFCRGVEAFARADRAFAVQGGEFDCNNYVLNTPAGTYNLHANIMRPHDPRDRITKSTAVAPSENGGERFRKFLTEITGGDRSMARFLQVSLGACLSGAIESHWMLFWTGSGRNGKNTLGDLVMHVMGDYAQKIPSSTLMAKSHEDHPTEIASLQGARLVVSSEVEDGAHWNEARINELTGDEMLTARFMRGNFFNFRRTHKHLIFGNHRPQLRSTTDALKSRIKIVPFKQSFLGREDAELPARLREEAGYVLYWLLEGHAAWLAAERKLPGCEAIDAESRDYFDTQSTVEAWVRESIINIDDDGRAASGWPKAGVLYANYKEWKTARGEQPVSQTRWGETMAKLFRKKEVNGVRYIGALLKPI